MRTRIAVLAAALLLLLGVAYTRGEAILRVTAEGVASFQFDGRFTIDALHITGRHLYLTGVRFERDNVTVLSIAHVDIGWRLRDLLPGSRHRFGVRSIAVSGVRGRVVRLANGLYALPRLLPRNFAVPTARNRVPIAFTLAISDASLILADTHGHGITVQGVSADGAFDTAATSTLHGVGSVAGAPRARLTLSGGGSSALGFSLYRLQISNLPLAGLVGVFLGDGSVTLRAGVASRVEGSLYQIGAPGSPIHLEASADLVGGALTIPGVDLPLEGLAGTLSIRRGGLYSELLSGTLGGLPVKASGALFDWHAPQLNVEASTHGRARAFPALLTWLRGRSVHGAVALGIRIEGATAAPTLLFHERSAWLSYQGYAFGSVDARAALEHGVLTIAATQAQYGALTLALRGTLALGQPVRSQLLLHAEGVPAAIPVAGELLGATPMRLELAVTGSGSSFGASGYLMALGDARRAGALIDLGADGSGTIAPIWLDEGAAQLAGAYVVPLAQRANFWVFGNALALHGHALPIPAGLPTFATVTGGLDRLAVVGGGPGRAIAGEVQGHSITIDGFPLATLALSASGHLPILAVQSLTASGGWGHFSGSGSLVARALALHGSAVLSPGRLTALSSLAAHGRLEGPVALRLSAGSIAFESSGMAGIGLTMRGVPVTRIAGALQYGGNGLRLEGLSVDAAHGQAFGIGSPGAAGGFSLLASGLQASELLPLGLPLQSGSIGARGELGFAGSSLSYRGALVLSAGRSGGIPVAGAGQVNYAGGNLSVSAAQGQFAGAVGTLTGHVAGIGGSAPLLALHAGIAAAAIAPTLDALGVHHPPVGGVLSGQLDLGGTLHAIAVRGALQGQGLHFNGQGIRRASARLAISPGTIAVTRGRLLVGSTATRLGARLNDVGAAFYLHATGANLEDFDDLFDTGDTLAGNGSISLGLRTNASVLHSTGALAIGGLRIRNLPLGSASAKWSSARNTIAGELTESGPYGALSATGSVTARPQAKWRSTLARSRYDLSARLTRLDLSTWIALLDLPRLPLTGRVDANASVQGTFPHATILGNAQLKAGTLAGLPIDNLAVQVSSNGSQVQLTEMTLQAPSLDAKASGSFGLTPTAPLDLHGSANTNDLAHLMTQLFHIAPPVTGAFESTFTAMGTIKRPTFQGGFDGQKVTIAGVAIPSLFGAVVYANGRLALRDAGARFAQGRADLSGSLPIELAPFALGPGRAPVDANLTISSLDPELAAPFLGSGSVLGGRIDGVGQIGGTLGNPTILGHFSISNGSYRSDLEQQPLTGISGELLFNRKHAELRSVIAYAGPGRLLGAGTLDIGAGGALSYQAHFQAQNASLNFPAFGSGQLDADLHLASRPNALALLQGNATLQSGVLPFLAFAGAAGGKHLIMPFDLAFNIGMGLGNNVSVRGSGYGAGLDIGATGEVQLAGTLRAPTLAGAFTATGGSLTYYDRSFRVDRATMHFRSADGVLPTLDASGSAQVSNPDPDRARNPLGTANVTVVVHGPLDALNVTLSSDPSYPREQILALIAPFGGVLGSAQAFGANSSVGGSLGEEAFNLLNAQFSSALLGPLESALGRGLGLSDLSLNLNYGGGVGVSARRILGKKVSLAYSTSFGAITRQSISIQFSPFRRTVASLSFFTIVGPQQFLTNLAANSTTIYGPAYLPGVAASGTNGFSFTLEWQR